MSPSRRHNILRFGSAVCAGLLAITLGACSAGETGTQSGGASDTESLNTPEANALETVTPGKLTIATGNPAFSPWVEDNDPESGKGLEAAVAYAVAEQMGFAPENVVWIRTPFDSVIAPGPKNFDINIQQFSITEKRKQAVDFSSPYYVSTQGILSIEGNPGSDAKSLADLKDVKFGVAAGSNAAEVIEKLVAPTQQIAVFNSNEDAVAALQQAHSIDALVTDLPTVLYLQAAVVDDGKVVGQFAPIAGDGDEYAFLLPKDSPLTGVVTKAVDELRADGTLAALEETWLAEGAGAPVLK